MKLGKKILSSNITHYIISFLGYLYARLIILTSNVVTIFPENFDHNIPYVYSLWHGRLFVPAILLPKNIQPYALVSGHKDGRILGMFLERMGVKIIYGSSFSGAVVAVRNLLKILQSGNSLYITPDGPRGPSCKINSNIIEIAKKTGSKIVPCSYSVDKFIVFKSWDKFMLPKLFSKIVMIYGDPIDTEYGIIKDLRKQLEDNINIISALADKIVQSNS